MVYYSYELRWSSSDNTSKEPDASGSFFFCLFYCFSNSGRPAWYQRMVYRIHYFLFAVIRTSADTSSVGAFLQRFIALYLRCRSAPTLILSVGAVHGKYTPFLYGRYEVTEDLDRPRAFAVERTAAL